MYRSDEVFRRREFGLDTMEDLTRNTGFEVSKGKIGECWIKSCCEWQNRMKSDFCGLDNNRLQLSDKMQRIYERTSLVTQFQNVGLEVAL